jgi:hypothetical protein
MSVRLSAQAREARVKWFEELRRVMTGGSIKFFAGERPATVNATLDPHNTELATFPLSPDLAWVVDESGVRVAGMPSAKATADGVPTFFRVVSAAGAVLMDGSVANTKPADILIDGHLWRGMEVSMPDFAYRSQVQHEPADGPRAPRRLRIAP